MNNIDQEFIEFVVKSLVGKPEAVQVERRIDEKGVLLELTVDPEDLGRVIGKRGATAQSLRTLLRALGTKNDARYNLKIIDNGTGEHAGSSDSSSADGEDAPAKPAKKSNKKTEAAPAAPAESVEEEGAAAAEDKTVEDETSDRLRQARAELDDLDDLDI